MEFRHTPDDDIFIDGLHLKLEEFLTEEPAYPGLPVDIIGFEYLVGRKHWAYNSNGDAMDPVIDEAILDGYIAKTDIYTANKVVRDAPPPPPPPPTNDEIYNQVMKNQKVFKAYALAVNDGSIVPGSNMTPANLKAAVKAKM